MAVKRSVWTLGAAAALLAMATAAAAGEFFRLEVGPPVAAGFANGQKIKDFKEAVLVVRPLACVAPGEPEVAQVAATAEGLVNGERQSIALKLQPLQPAGVFAVMRQWPVDGSWVVHLAGACAKRNATASTVVPVSGRTFNRERTKVLAQAATKADIDAALQSARR